MRDNSEGLQHKLLVDAKTLRDISRVLSIEEKFKYLPDMLDRIADDIEYAAGEAK